MKKIGIIGAGVSGLSLGRFLKDTFNVEILESKGVVGGIARTRKVGNITYHQVGGHCFNSKYKDVLDFVFKHVLPLEQWRLVKRKSMIRLLDYEIPYPIEFSMKEIYSHDPNLAIRMTADFLNANDDCAYGNLDDWFRKKFGNSLAQEYFIPYNTKIWNVAPSKMNPEWVEGKLPMPNKASFFESLIGKSEDSMPHSSFYYPKSNDMNTFIDALSQGLNVVCNYRVSSICYNEDTNKWIINNEKEFDLILNTSPIDRLPFIIAHAPDKVLDAAKLLKYNKISNVLWKTRLTDKTWTYLPNPSIRFHRYIHVGAYFNPISPYSISEAVGAVEYKDLIAEANKDPFLEEPLAYNQSEHAYVVFDENYDYALDIVKSYLKSIGMPTVGRFGEWQYYNMDVCIHQSMDLAKSIIKDYV